MALASKTSSLQKHEAQLKDALAVRSSFDRLKMAPASKTPPLLKYTTALDMIANVERKMGELAAT